MKLHGLGYIGFTAPEPKAWLPFGSEILGVMPARFLPGESPGRPGLAESGPASGGTGVAADGSVFLKMDDRQWRIAIHPGDAAGVAYLGFEVSGAGALEEAVAEVSASGTTITRGTPEETTARGVQGLAWCIDPSGTRVELFHGPVNDGNFASPTGAEFLTGDLGLGHALFFTADMDASLAFYLGVLGFKRSDLITVGPGMSVQFLRCTPRHHSIALLHVGPFAGVHHLMLEVTSIDDVGRALDRATDAGHVISMSLGRHCNDGMVSFYMHGPSGFDVEVGWDGTIVDDDWCDREVAAEEVWGHRGLTVEEFQEIGESLS